MTRVGFLLIIHCPIFRFTPISHFHMDWLLAACAKRDPKDTGILSSPHLSLVFAEESGEEMPEETLEELVDAAKAWVEPRGEVAEELRERGYTGEQVRVGGFVGYKVLIEKMNSLDEKVRAQVGAGSEEKEDEEDSPRGSSASEEEF